MNSSIALNEADEQRLELLLDHEFPPPVADTEQRKTVKRLLKASRSTPEADRLDHVGFGDRVVLAAPGDPRDNFVLTICMPRDADVDHDRISVLAPISLAVLGRSAGDGVAWETPVGKRKMTIMSISKGYAPALVTA